MMRSMYEGLATGVATGLARTAGEKAFKTILNSMGKGEAKETVPDKSQSSGSTANCDKVSLCSIIEKFNHSIEGNDDLKHLEFEISQTRKFFRTKKTANGKVIIQVTYHENEIFAEVRDTLASFRGGAFNISVHNNQELDLKNAPHAITFLTLQLVSMIISKDNTLKVKRAAKKALIKFLNGLLDYKESAIITDFHNKITEKKSSFNNKTLLVKLEELISSEEKFLKNKVAVASAKTFIDECKIVFYRLQILNSNKKIPDGLESNCDINNLKKQLIPNDKESEAIKELISGIENKLDETSKIIEFFEKIVDLGGIFFSTKLKYDELLKSCSDTYESIESLADNCQSNNPNEVGHNFFVRIIQSNTSNKDRTRYFGLIKSNFDEGGQGLKESKTELDKKLGEANSSDVMQEITNHSEEVKLYMLQNEKMLERFIRVTQNVLPIADSHCVNKRQYIKLLGLNESYDTSLEAGDFDIFFKKGNHTGNLDQLNPEQKFQNALILKHKGKFKEALELLQNAEKEGCTYANAEIGLFYSGWLDHKLEMRTDKAKAMELFRNANTARAQYFMSELLQEHPSCHLFKGYKIEDSDCPEEAKKLDPLHVKDEKTTLSKGEKSAQKSTLADFSTFESQEEFDDFYKDKKQKDVIKKTFVSRTADNLTDTYLKDYYQFLFSVNKADKAKEFYDKLISKGGKPRSYSLLGKHYFDCGNYKLAMRLFEIGWYDYGDMFSAMYLFFYYEEPSHVQAEFSQIHIEKAKQFVDNWLSLTDKIDLDCPPINFIKFSESLGLDDYLKKEKKVDIAKFRSDHAKQDNHNLIKDLYKKYTVETVEEHAIVMYLIYKSQMSTAEILSRQDIKNAIDKHNPFGDLAHNDPMNFQRVTSKYGQIPCFKYANVLDKEFKFEEGICLRTYSKRGRVLIERNRHEDAFACFKSGYDKGDIYSTPYLLMCYVFACGTKRDLVKANKVAEKLGKFDINTHILVEICLDKINSMELDLDIYNFIDLIETKVGYYLANILRVLTHCITLDGIPRFFLKGVVDGTLNQNLKVEDPQNKSNIKESDSTYAVLPEQLCRLVMDCVSLIHGVVLLKEEKYDGLLKDIHNFITGKYEGESKLLKFKKSMSEASASSNNFAEGLKSYNKDKFDEAKKYFGAGKENDPYCQQWAFYLDYCIEGESEQLDKKFLDRKILRDGVIYRKELKPTIDNYINSQSKYDEVKVMVTKCEALTMTVLYNRPNVLVTGRSMVGKTTFVNSMYVGDRGFLINEESKEYREKYNKINLENANDEENIKEILEDLPTWNNSCTGYFVPVKNLDQGEGEGYSSTTKFGDCRVLATNDGASYSYNLIDCPGFLDNKQNTDFAKDILPIFMFWNVIGDLDLSAVCMVTSHGDESADKNLLKEIIKFMKKKQLLNKFVNIKNKYTTHKQSFCDFLKHRIKPSCPKPLYNLFNWFNEPPEGLKEKYKEFIESLETNEGSSGVKTLYMDVTNGMDFRRNVETHIKDSIEEGKKFKIKDYLNTKKFFDGNVQSEALFQKNLKTYFEPILKRFSYLSEMYNLIKGINAKQEEDKENKQNYETALQGNKKALINSAADKILRSFKEIWKEIALFDNKTSENFKEEKFIADLNGDIRIFDAGSNFTKVDTSPDELPYIKTYTIGPENKLERLARYKCGDEHGKYPFYYKKPEELKEIRDKVKEKYELENVVRFIEYALGFITDGIDTTKDFISGLKENFQVKYTHIKGDKKTELKESDFLGEISSMIENSFKNKNQDVPELFDYLKSVEPNQILHLMHNFSNLDIKKDTRSCITNKEARMITERAYQVYVKYLPSVYKGIFNGLRRNNLPKPIFIFSSACFRFEYLNFLKTLTSPHFIKDYYLKRAAVDEDSLSLLGLESNTELKQSNNFTFVKEENKETMAQGCYYMLNTGSAVWVNYNKDKKSQPVPYSTKKYVIRLFSKIDQESFKNYSSKIGVNRDKNHPYPFREAKEIIKEHKLCNFKLKSVSKFSQSEIFCKLDIEIIAKHLIEKEFLDSSGNLSTKLGESKESFEKLIMQNSEEPELSLVDIEKIIEFIESNAPGLALKEIFKNVKEKVSSSFEIELVSDSKSNHQGKEVPASCINKIDHKLVKRGKAKVALLSKEEEIKTIIRKSALQLGNTIDLKQLNDKDLRQLKQYYPNQKTVIDSYCRNKEEVYRYLAVDATSDSEKERFMERIRKRTVVSIYQKAKIKIAKEKLKHESKLSLLEQKFGFSAVSASDLINEYKQVCSYYELSGVKFSEDEKEECKVLQRDEIEIIAAHYGIEPDRTISLNFDQVDKIRSFFTNYDDSEAIHQDLRRIVENSAITEAMKANMLERLQPNYFWREINEFNDEEKKQIEDLGITPPEVNRQYETSSDNWEQGSYIIFSPGHFTASPGHFTAMHVEESKIMLFDSNSDTHPMYNFEFSKDVKSIERKQQEINDCWGRSFLYLTEDLADVEGNDARSVMIERLRECYKWLGEQGELVDIQGQENELKRAFDELWDVNENGERFYKDENSMLDISIMDALLRWENAKNSTNYKLLQIREGQVYFYSEKIRIDKLLSEAKWDDIRDLDFIRTKKGYETVYDVGHKAYDILNEFKECLVDNQSQSTTNFEEVKSHHSTNQ